MWHRLASGSSLVRPAENSKFSFTVTPFEIASQVAFLLNVNNSLEHLYDAQRIINSPVQYFIELHGHKVTGCVGLLRETKMDKVVHLSVDQKFRGIGIGAKLLSTAVNASLKDTIYMTIRDSNIPSQRVASKLGFKFIAYIPKYDYNLFTFCLFRRSDVFRK